MGILTRLALVSLALYCAVPAHAAGNLTLREQEIKTGLLYNFIKYTQWPASILGESDPITVCIFGDDPFGGGLDRMKDRTVNRHPIALRHLQEIKEAEVCHLLFINAEEKKRWPALHTFLRGKSVMTVSDFGSFATSGGMIEFGHSNNRIGAQLNTEAVNAAGLRIEDRLLRLVTLMKPQGAQ